MNEVVNAIFVIFFVNFVDNLTAVIIVSGGIDWCQTICLTEF